MMRATINQLMWRQILGPPHFSGQSPAETYPALICANAIAPSGPARGPNPAATTIVDRQLRKIVRDDVPCRVVRGHGGGRRPEAALERGPADQPLDAITMEGTR